MRVAGCLIGQANFPTDPEILEDIVSGAHEFHGFAILFLRRLEFRYIRNSFIP